MRELEGALKRVIAHSHFMGRDITIELIRESLKDLLALQDKLVSVDNIQRTVAEYYKIKISDLLEKLALDDGKLERKLAPGHNGEPRLSLNEAQFRWASNEDAMATEKLAEGIRQFARDQEKLEALLSAK